MPGRPSVLRRGGAHAFARGDESYATFLEHLLDGLKPVGKGIDLAALDLGDGIAGQGRPTGELLLRPAKQRPPALICRAVIIDTQHVEEVGSD
jgi:hypothetical protein